MLKRRGGWLRGSERWGERMSLLLGSFCRDPAVTPDQDDRLKVWERQGCAV